MAREESCHAPEGSGVSTDLGAGGRIEERSFAELDALVGREPPMPALLSEWLALLTARPVANTVLVAAAAAMLVLTSPLAALPFALFA